MIFLKKFDMSKVFARSIVQLWTQIVFNMNGSFSFYKYIKLLLAAQNTGWG